MFRREVSIPPEMGTMSAQRNAAFAGVLNRSNRPLTGEPRKSRGGFLTYEPGYASLPTILKHCKGDAFKCLP
jgi:hypothetical protein